MSDQKYPVAPEKVAHLESKAMELKKALHEKINEFAKETGHGFVVTMYGCESPKDMFTCRPCY